MTCSDLGARFLWGKGEAGDACPSFTRCHPDASFYNSEGLVYSWRCQQSQAACQALRHAGWAGQKLPGRAARGHWGGHPQATPIRSRGETRSQCDWLRAKHTALMPCRSCSFRGAKVPRRACGHSLEGRRSLVCPLEHRATASPEHFEKPSLSAGETMVQCAMREVRPESIARVRKSMVMPLLQ